MPLTLNVTTLEEIVLGKCNSFVNMGVWPPGEKLTPRRWLNNFNPSEKEHALYLLNSFVYYNMDMSMGLLKGALLNLSKHLSNSLSLAQQISEWKLFIEGCLFVPVTGEIRNVTDSGNLIAGRLRRDLLIDENKIVTVEKLYDTAYNGFLKDFARIIFFDDFVGSGQQFITMWCNEFEKDCNLLIPVKKQCEMLKLTPYYCAMIGTNYGITRIKGKAPEVNLSFAHILGDVSSPLHSESSTWPEHLKNSGPQFILDASDRAGIPKDAIKGFHNLGLALAFDFTIPDATLPIFQWNKGNWSPLMERN